MNTWQQLLAVQELDTHLRQLDHRDANLPQRADLAAVEGELAELRSQIEAAEAEKHGLQRELKKIEDEVALTEDKVAHVESQMYGGGSSDPGLLQDLQADLESLKRRISGLEDDELELMEQIEPIDARLASFADQQAELDARAVSVTKDLAETEAVIGDERSGILAQRTEAVGGIAPDALARYESVRNSFGGTAVAALEGGVCQACHIKLSAVERDRIQHLSPDDEVTCEECGRFLVRT